MSGEFNRNDVDFDRVADRNGSLEPDSPDLSHAPTNGGSTVGSVDDAPVPVPVPASASAARETPKAVDDVLYSDIGITTLLNRLKQSVASARDFASFLQKRSKLEEEQASGLKRLATGHIDALKKIEMRGGSYSSQVTEVMRVHERMADNGMQFALSLHQMHEDLNTLTTNMERGRKTIKHEGLDAETRASQAEAAMQKAKSKYDGLADDFDRAKTGDTKGSRRIGLKGPKSQEQYESDLQRKLQAADADYEERVRLARTQRELLISDHRPKAVRQLRELCRECDAALTLQLQKFATFNEKLLLGNGLAVSPLTAESGTHKSLRDVITDIDNEKDFHSFVGSHVNKIPARPSEIKYEPHHTLASKTQQPTSRSVSTNAPTIQPPVREPTLNINTGPTSQPTSMNSRYSTQQAPPGPLVAPSQGQAYSQPEYSAPEQRSYGQPPASYRQAPSQAQPQPSSPYQSQSSPMQQDSYAAPPYPTHPSERTNSSFVPQQTTGIVSSPSPPPLQQQQQQQPRSQYTKPPPSAGGAGPMSPAGANLPRLRPTFGISLQELFDRDQSAVPLVVIQCILAVDHFGIETTGIYRQSGTSSHVQRLIGQFDHNPNTVDFRNPAAFYHDVNIPASLLKHFFKQLPDPLFPNSSYNAFIDAARLEEQTQRRDGLHALINELPDPNYATLRALVLHLHRVAMNESKNRMGSGNLAVCFAPSLMGTGSGGQIADAGLQARVVDTILMNATAIFDED
ncbi:Rho GTPase-activating protein [Recurvomyces mirabilis]|uniref:Rho GTPase-activating protein n=1 Tax=Recurvomyces mirabilis TaxID=574656 RepID=A0AAE0TNP8_9PEZI|nr:Rho GTPase-activating protein [Recurvomyces mirabilis]KAK5154336.1 Rho GTPase-activating protein [Recurvomyces mirabilis]